MGNQGEFICPNCQGKLLHMVQKKDMTKDEINIEIEEAKKGNGMDRFKIIDEKLYRYEWESGLMIWSYTKKELKWNKTKEGTWFCKCGYYSQNYKDFTEKSSQKKDINKNEEKKITITEEQYNNYNNDLAEANKKIEEKDKKIEDLEEQIKSLKAKLIDKNEDENKV